MNTQKNPPDFDSPKAESTEVASLLKKNDNT